MCSRTGSRSWRASSGSRSASSSMEPFRSANSTVTCLRSPSRRTAGGENFLGQVERSIGQGGRLGVWVRCRDGRCRGRGGSSGLGLPPPHQPPAIFIYNVGMGKEEIFFQVFQGRVIQVELPFERAIGDALTAPEQVNDLVQHCIKVHPSPHTRQAWRGPPVDRASYGTKREHCQPDTPRSQSSTHMSGRIQRGKILCFLMKKQADRARRQGGEPPICNTTWQATLPL